jgi:Flp pilus assembly protein TadG
VLIEFVFILPLFLFLVLFSVDMGRMMVAYGVLSDATYVAARAGAQAGSPAPVTAAFNQAITATPVRAGPSRIVSVTGTCRQANPDRFITVTASQDVAFITPGLGQLLAVFDGQGADTGPWSLTARGSVLCEVVRP